MTKKGLWERYFKKRQKTLNVNNRLANIDDYIIAGDLSTMLELAIKWSENAKMEEQKRVANEVFNVASRLFSMFKVGQSRANVIITDLNRIEGENLILKNSNKELNKRIKELELENDRIKAECFSQI